MKISICIPQYNRIHYLLKSLAIIEKQTYADIEIAISDDCSTDETETEIKKLATHYKYPIIFDRNEKNMGYDRNYRKCIEIATGDYAFVIGNDDSIIGDDSIEFLANFIESNNFPDIGYCNMTEERTGGTIIKRAVHNTTLGSGAEVALKNYSCFSFVGGLVYKRATFLANNTAKYDGSIFAQMYLGVYMIAKGATLFSIERPMVLKDILLDGVFRNSYRDRIAKRWSDMKVIDGGLPSVMNVLIQGLKDAGALKQHHIYFIFRRMYLITYPHWILDYKDNGALPAAVGLIIGMKPTKNANFAMLTVLNKLCIVFFYFYSSVVGLVTPVFIFRKVKQRLYDFFKSRK
jgi:glycosyltransferase involved in cell wall biosynthesis